MDWLCPRLCSCVRSVAQTFFFCQACTRRSRYWRRFPPQSPSDAVILRVRQTPDPSVPAFVDGVSRGSCRALLLCPLPCAAASPLAGSFLVAGQSLRWGDISRLGPPTFSAVVLDKRVLCGYSLASACPSVYPESIFGTARTKVWTV